MLGNITKSLYVHLRISISFRPNPLKYVNVTKVCVGINRTCLKTKHDILHTQDRDVFAFAKRVEAKTLKTFS